VVELAVVPAGAVGLLQIQGRYVVLECVATPRPTWRPASALPEPHREWLNNRAPLIGPTPDYQAE
jgi:hypothetical protein